MALPINTRSYTVDDTSTKGRVIYRDPSSTAGLPSTALLARVDPMPTGTFNGVSKADFRLDKVTTVNEKNWPLIIRLSSSLPVGTPDADSDLIIADFRAFVASAAFVDLVKGGKIYHA